MPKKIPMLKNQKILSKKSQRAYRQDSFRQDVKLRDRLGDVTCIGYLIVQRHRKVP